VSVHQFLLDLSFIGLDLSFIGLGAGIAIVAIWLRR
jgi:hypothetical protein